MKKSTQEKSFWSGRGFYVALALVICGSALASYLAINTMMKSLGTTDKPNSNSNITGQEDIIWQENNTQTQQPQGNIPEKPSSLSGSQSGSSSAAAPSASSSGQQEPENLQPAQGTSFTSPMQGKVCAGFSGDELVFNATMQDWRTHNGTDIAGAVNTSVKAPMKALVSAVHEDSQWGGVVELGSGNMVVRLCGMKNITVKQGDTVRAGQALGQLGNVPAESAVENHLHVEVIKDGKLIDPAQYIA